MSSKDHFRENAAGCLDKAQHAKDDAERAMWLKMAEAWLGMAHRAEERDGGERPEGEALPKPVYDPEKD